jgi:carbon storage regulator CsrA
MRKKPKKPNHTGDFNMTILRKSGEGVKLVGNFNEISITVFDIQRNKVKFGINAPQNFAINLTEKYQRMQANLQQQLEAYHHQTQQEQQRRENLLSTKRANSKIKAQVLLVEDDLLIRTATLSYLRTLGYQVDIAVDGRQSYDLLRKQYDIILLDIGLPDTTGMEICKRVRKQGVNLNTPVIFLTAHGESAREKCMLAGGSDFATKPVTMEKLQQLLHRWLF